MHRDGKTLSDLVSCLVRSPGAKTLAGVKVGLDGQHGGVGYQRVQLVCGHGGVGGVQAGVESLLVPTLIVQGDRLSLASLHQRPDIIFHLKHHGPDCYVN